MPSPLSRELPAGVRQQAAADCIPSEQRTEAFCRLRRFVSVTARLSAGVTRNESGTAEVHCAFVS